MTRQLTLLGVVAAGLVAGASGHAQKNIYTFRGENAGDRFGRNVAVVGDLDNDRVPDIVVGGYRHNSGAGRVYAYSGRCGARLWTIDGVAGSNYGWYVVAVGDVDRDGAPDIGVSALRANGAATASGRAWVVSGRDRKVLHTLDGSPVANSLFGISMAGLGDLNGDGHPEIGVAQQRDTTRKGRRGSAWVFSGKDGSTLRTFWGREVDDTLDVIASVGDVDADSVPDLAVGGLGGGAKPGRIEIYSGRTCRWLYDLYGDRNGDGFGLTAALGDLDRDGHDDFAIGALGDDELNLFSGKTGALIKQLTGPAGSFYGVPLGLGRVDADAVPDYAVGAYWENANGARSGSVRIYSGATHTQIDRFVGENANDWFGVGLASADVNRDGSVDLLATGMAHRNDTGMLRVLSLKTLALSSPTHTVSVAAPQPQQFLLDAGRTHANRRYLLAGSFSGTTPGVLLGGLRIPLNFDPYMALTVGSPNTVIAASLGTLDANGRSRSPQLRLPRGLGASSVGLCMHHAFLVISGVDLVFASNAIPTVLVD